MAFLVERCGELVLSDDISHANTVPAPFLTKTYQLVDDPGTDNIVSWGDDGSTLVVWRPAEFARELLPKYFNHNNFSSFVRQLNNYGFRKLLAGRWEFMNVLFVKGAKHLLVEIRRKNSPHPLKRPLPPNLSYHDHHLRLNRFFTPSKPPPQAVSQDFVRAGGGNNNDDSGYAGGHDNAGGSAGGGCLAALSEDNRELRRRNTLLRSELAHMRNLYNDIVYLQNHVAPVTSSTPAAVHASQPSGCGVAPAYRVMELDPVQEPPRHEVTHHAVKLFGVTLHGNKKKRAHQEGGDGNHGEGSSAV